MMTDSIETMRTVLREALARPPLEQEVSVDRAQFLGELIHVRLEHLHMSIRALADLTHLNEDELEAIIEGFLPAELIRDEVLMAIGNQINIHPNIFRIILGRNIDPTEQESSINREELIAVLNAVLLAYPHIDTDDALAELMAIIEEYGFSSQLKEELSPGESLPLEKMLQLRVENVFRRYAKELQHDFTLQLKQIHGGNGSLLRFHCQVKPQGEMNIHPQFELGGVKPRLLDETVTLDLDGLSCFYKHSVVILGKPNSGKTTLMAGLAVRLAEHYLRQKSKFQMPLYLQMQGWDGQATLSDFLSDFLELSASLVQQYLDQQRWQIFIDGVDQLPPQTLASPRFRAFFRSIAENTRKLPIVWASRSETYRLLTQLCRQKLPVDYQVYLQPLSRNYVEKYIRSRWTDRLWTYIARDEHLIQLCRHQPLNLQLVTTSITQVEAKLEPTIKDEGTEFWIYFFYMFIREQYRLTRQIQPENVMFSPENLHEILGRMASYDEHHLQHDMLENLLKDDTHQFVTLIKQFSLVQQIVDDTYTFTHPMLARYFKLVFAFLTSHVGTANVQPKMPDLATLLDWIVERDRNTKRRRIGTNADMHTSPDERPYWDAKPFQSINYDEMSYESVSHSSDR